MTITKALRTAFGIALITAPMALVGCDDSASKPPAPAAAPAAPSAPGKETKPAPAPDAAKKP